MEDLQYLPNNESVLDGNAAAGLLQEAFGTEMTANKVQCASCGKVSRVGALLVYGSCMGSVLRCPGCQGMMLRIASRHDALWLDMQGVTYLRQERVAP
jgi:hypothetical protein